MKPSQTTCPFCQMVAGEEPALIVGDFPYALAFTPLAPAAWGHTLVIPKRHTETLWDLPPERGASLLYAIRSMDSKLRKALSPDGMNLIQSTGAAAGQTVPHLYFHLVPRWEGDHLGDLWASGREWWRSYRGNETEYQRRARMAAAINGEPS